MASVYFTCDECGKSTELEDPRIIKATPTRLEKIWHDRFLEYFGYYEIFDELQKIRFIYKGRKYKDEKTGEIKYSYDRYDTREMITGEYLCYKCNKELYNNQQVLA